MFAEKGCETVPTQHSSIIMDLQLTPNSEAAFSESSKDVRRCRERGGPLWESPEDFRGASREESGKLPGNLWSKALQNHYERSSGEFSGNFRGSSGKFWEVQKLSRSSGKSGSLPVTQQSCLQMTLSKWGGEAHSLKVPMGWAIVFWISLGWVNTEASSMRRRFLARSPSTQHRRTRGPPKSLPLPFCKQAFRS